jgi:hypothetical protein
MSKRTIISNMLYTPAVTCSEEEYVYKYEGAIKANERRISLIEKEAIRSGGLLYRFIKEPVADGQAVYQITRVGRNTVDIELCQIDPVYIDYIVPYWGQGKTIERAYAEKSIAQQDAFRKMFEK